MKTPPMALDGRDEWFDAARDALDTLIETRHLFSADDMRPLVPEPGHPSWWGALFAGAREAGRIKPMGFMLSRSKSRKNGVIRVWAQVIQHEDRTP